MGNSKYAGWIVAGIAVLLNLLGLVSDGFLSGLGAGMLLSILFADSDRSATQSSNL